MVKFINSIPKDKKDHIIVGLIYSTMIIVFAFIGSFFNFTFIGASLGFAVGTYFNLWKELWHDWKLGKGNPEWLDFIATEIPILITYLAFLI